MSGLASLSEQPHHTLTIYYVSFIRAPLNLRHTINLAQNDGSMVYEVDINFLLCDQLATFPE